VVSNNVMTAPDSTTNASRRNSGSMAATALVARLLLTPYN
jgi:hypothetical protein